jgi:hypothetical protein
VWWALCRSKLAYIYRTVAWNYLSAEPVAVEKKSKCDREACRRVTFATCFESDATNKDVSYGG